MIPLPDLLHDRPHAGADNQFLLELLEMAFLGSNESRGIDEGFGRIPLPQPTWNPDFFVNDLFLEDFLRHLSTLVIDGRDYPIHTAFVLRVLSQPPVDLQSIHFRQAILRELEADEVTRSRVTTLYTELVALLDQLKSTHTHTLLDIAIATQRLPPKFQSVAERFRPLSGFCVTRGLKDS